MPRVQNGPFVRSFFVIVHVVRLELRSVAVTVAIMLFAVVTLPIMSTQQRPSDASLCDYYATQLYGANTSDTQFQFVQSVVALAYIGGANIPNVSSEITGILNPGTFQGTPVDLQPWFNASIASTNVNNGPIAINWLDGGNQEPLYAFLSGSSPNIVFTNTTNEYTMFSHFLSSFSDMFACTLPKAAPSKSAVGSLAYVHKYMGLNYTDMGHFIKQLTLSTTHFGFSKIDSETLSTQLNAQYNVRCSPPVTSSSGSVQLYSLCQDATCPLAPNPDCAIYENLEPGGVSLGSASGSPATSTSPTSTSNSPASASSTSTHQSSSISAGAIAGIAIGGAVVLFIFIAVLVFLLRRKRNHDPYAPHLSTANPSYTTPSHNLSDHHTSYMDGQGRVEQWNKSAAQEPVYNLDSNLSPEPEPIYEMETPRVGESPEMGQILAPKTPIAESPVRGHY